MKNLVTRIVSCRLVPCLLADPGLAVTLSCKQSNVRLLLSPFSFSEQAIVPSSFTSRKTDPIKCSEVTEMAVNQTRGIVHGMTRRTFGSALAGFFLSMQAQPPALPPFQSTDQMNTLKLWAQAISRFTGGAPTPAAQQEVRALIAKAQMATFQASRADPDWQRLNSFCVNLQDH